MTPEEAIIRIQNSIYKTPRGDRWGLLLSKKWRRAWKTNTGKKGIRVPEYESIIAQNLDCVAWYALNVVREKLPKKMHNLMVSYAISDPENHCVKLYFEMAEKQLERNSNFALKNSIVPCIFDREKSVKTV